MNPDIAVRRLATVVVAVCLVVVGMTGVAALRPEIRAKLGLGETREQAYVVGGQIDVPDELYRPTAQTLIIFARESCAACRQAKPLIAALTRRLATVPSFRVVLATNRPTSPGEIRFAEAVGLDRADVVGVDFRALRLRLVPTVAVVDKTGRIRYVREGILTDLDIDQLVIAVTSPTH